MNSALRNLMWIVVAAALPTTLALAQAPPQPRPRNWELGARLAITGASRSSDPSGYSAYSTFPLEGFASRRLSQGVSIQFTARLESREVEQTTPTTMPLGSIEFVPMNLLLHYRLSRGGWSPYVALGANATLVWEKSGLLDAMDASPSFGPAVGIGLNKKMTDYMVWNVEFRWNTARTELSSNGVREMRLTIDPASLGVGFGVRF